MLVSASNLFFSYGSRQVVEDVSLEVASGQIVAVLGSNGSGKSTLMKLVAGLLKPAKGTVKVENQTIVSMTRRQIAQAIAYVAQETKLQFPLSAIEFVLQGRFPHGKGLGFESDRDIEIAQMAMNLTDTIAFAHRELNTLSGGERQRVFLARAIAQEPKLLLLDEPTSNLDISHRVATFLLMKRLAEQKKIGIMLVTHEINLTAEFADHILLLKNGCTFISGSVEEVFKKHVLEEVFETKVLIDKNSATGAPRVTLDTRR
ncbi:MAG: ABC transporter ATP-binding protein [Blastocatellia bacterium]|nr:ABC transporter ATP-binding protein [Blastocatellia bacterium]